MTISNIELIENKNIKKRLPPIKEVMDIHVKDIMPEIPSRNGGIVVFSGSGGSGKTSLLLSMFKSKDFYRNKFHNVYYIVPESSFLSVAKHPFKKHEKVYHDLTPQLLETIYKELLELKTNEDKEEIEYNCVIIDDFASTLKEKPIQTLLQLMLIKSRHLNTMFIFTLQSYYLFPKILRKMINYIVLFKVKNMEEWMSISKELLSLNTDDGLLLYDYSFKTKYNHLDIDTTENKLYLNFNEIIIHK